WSVYLLPYIEQDNLYKRLNPASNTLASVFKNDLAALQTPVPVYVCPSDNANRPPLNDNRPFTKMISGQSVLISISNYPGCTGNGGGSGLFQGASAQGLLAGNATPVTHPISDITDGTSNSFAVGERCSQLIR